MYLSAGRVRQWVHTDDRWCVSEMVSCLGQEVQGNCLNLELLLLFFGLLLLFLFNSPEWNEKGEGVKPRFIIKTFFAVLNFACADYFSCRHLCSQTRTYTFTHKTIHAGLTSKKEKKNQRILNIERLLKRLFSSSFFILQTGEVTQSATNNNIFFYTFVFTSCSSSSVLYLSTLSSVLGLNSFLVDYLTDDGGEVGGEKEHTKLPLGLWSIEHNNNNNDLKKKKKKKKK